MAALDPATHAVVVEICSGEPMADQLAPHLAKTELRVEIRGFTEVEPLDSAHVVLVHHPPPGEDVLNRVSRWREQSPGPAWVVLMPAVDPPTFERALAAGVECSLPESVEPTVLVNHLRVLAQLGRTRQALHTQQQLSLANQQQFVTSQHRKDDVTAHVVHDLKNRLASILPNAQFLLMETGLSEEGKGAALDIVAASESMHRMAVNLVDINRWESGTLQPSLGKVDLSALVQEVRNKMTRHAAEKQQVLDFSEVTANVQLKGDRAMLRRLVENLVDNSIHYGPVQGTVRVGLCLPADGMVELRIADEGHAMAEPLRAKAFDRDSQLDLVSEPTTRISPGLGLVFCKVVTDVHKGSICMQEVKPRGQAFVVRLRAENGN